MRKPNFFILGAPKCGTTALASWLAEHPQVFMSLVKEPDYFYPGGKTKSQAEYDSLFEAASSEHIVVGEASVRYLYGKSTISRIFDYVEDRPKFIVMLRNPLEMAISLHAQRCYTMNETETDFRKAWSLQNHDGTPRTDLPKTVYTPELSNYGPICKTGENLQRVLSDIGNRGDTLVFFLDDIVKNPKSVWDNVSRFLEISNSAYPSFEHLNRRKQHRIPSITRILSVVQKVSGRMHFRGGTGIAKRIRELNTKTRNQPELGGAMREELIDYFSDDIMLIESLTGRDMSTWKQKP